MKFNFKRGLRYGIWTVFLLFVILLVATLPKGYNSVELTALMVLYSVPIAGVAGTMFIVSGFTKSKKNKKR